MTEPLATLNDIQYPFAGWLIPVVLISILILGLWVIKWGYSWFLRTAPCRRALRQLNHIVNEHNKYNDDTQFVLSISLLLHEFSQQRWPEADSVYLTGKDWLVFLESHNGKGDFIDGVGSVLAWRAYSSSGEVDPAGLTTMIKRWLKDNSE